MSDTTPSATKPKGRVLILVENLSLPFDRRPWREALALREAGYQVAAISPKGDTVDTAGHEVIDGVSIYRYRPFESTGGAVSYLIEYGVAMLMMGWLSLVVFVREGFDVIHLCNPPDTLILLALPYKILGKRVVYDQHDLAPDMYVMHKNGATGGFMYKALRFFERLTYRGCDVIVTINESYRQVALTRGGVPHEKTFVVRNGPDRASLKDVQPRPELRRGKPYLLAYVGMMGPQDGVDILVRAVRHLIDDFGRDDFHVHVMGGGTELERLKAYAAELGVAEYLTFTGRVPYAEVMVGIASADVCVAPDPKTPLNDKANLVKVLEYMAMGKPLVAFDLCEVRYSAEDAALYAKPNEEKDLAEKIHILLESPEMRERLGRIGKERILAGLTWDKSKEHLWEAYRAAFRMGDKTA